MGSNNTASEESVSGFLGRSIETIGGSYLLSLAAFGIFLIVIGGFVLDGVLAGMFGIWGFTGLLVGLIGYGLYQYAYRP